MPLNLPKSLIALILATVTAQSAAADATSTIRAVMGGSLSALVTPGGVEGRIARPRGVPQSDADTLMRAMLGDRDWPRAVGVQAGSDPAPLWNGGWGPMTRCTRVGAYRAPPQFESLIGWAGLRPGLCTGTGRVQSFRLGTALGPLFGALAVADRLRSSDYAIVQTAAPLIIDQR